MGEMEFTTEQNEWIKEYVAIKQEEAREKAIDDVCKFLAEQLKRLI